MIKILTKIDGINNVLENSNLLEIEFEKKNIIKIFNELKDNTELNFNQLLDITAVDYLSREFRFDLIYILPIRYIKHYKSTEYMKRTILSINMIGNEKQKTWQKNTFFTSKMLKGLCPC